MGEIERARPAAAWLNRQGWATMNVDYRPGAAAETDIRLFYDLLRHRVGPHAVICALGQSAGAQLALMLAAARPRLGCVIAEGAPVDLPALATQSAPDPAGEQQTSGPLGALMLATQAFGVDGLRAHSPITVAARIRARVLAANAANDQLIPVAQLHALARAIPSAVTMTLAPGNVPFIHGYISAAASRAYGNTKRALLAGALRDMHHPRRR